jgi:sialidase-1
MSPAIEAEHGVVCRLGHEPFGYFGWPSVTMLDDGTLVVASSGLRTEHVCPFGKTVLNVSHDSGRTWSPPRVINNSPLDDRDAGVIALGGGAMLVSWFTSDTRRYLDGARRSLPAEDVARWEEVIGTWTDELVRQHLGSWVLLSEDGATWGEPIRVPVSAPHGPIRLADGELLYLGNSGFHLSDQDAGQLIACRSADSGRTWAELGRVPIAEGTRQVNYCEPHAVELTDGRLVGMIRFEGRGEDDPAGDQHFHLYQTTSADGGRSWSRAMPTGVYGSPPHLLRHSSGPLICVYGYRRPPYGQRMMLSHDGGESWDADWILRDDGPDADLGYPSSVEMPDGTVLTVYYQKFRAGEKCSLLWTRWSLP